jgi:hypothetical protein
MARNTYISASVMSHMGEDPLSSVSVTVIISISLHHRQCDNFGKIQEEDTKWTGATMNV